ncbi:hypothetical protein [Phycicoccus duodecadis]|uniref:Bacteriocin biosynthesis cyclodehydratase domain-containing protein n=1 Tax=Phycicoccus duodecadis TaxID=173053 RepID=A0A2N3YH03_9MICO|nr:hypothetical protein [Phycicoccus duodecadis]PKW26110.1 hypothetical protein ATL31_0916 [Phycicoccus duodecadis]
MGRSEVVVDGAGPLAAETVAQLRRCGVRVRAGALAADAAELEVAGGAPPPALVVLVADGEVPLWRRAPSAVAPWHRLGVPQLPVTAGPGPLVVGPLVVPGRPPCLACVGGGLPAARAVAGGPAPRPDHAAVLLAAAVTSVTALGVLGGDTTLAAISTEIGARAVTVVHRVWGSRPGCPCASATMAG